MPHRIGPTAGCVPHNQRLKNPVLHSGCACGTLTVSNEKEGFFVKYVKQVLIILGFTFLGEILARVIPLPIPAAIYGIVLLLIALGTGALKTGQVKETSHFLISIMPVLYIPVNVRILEYWNVISQNAAAIIIITVVSTYLVFGVSGLVTQRLMKKKGGKDHG